MFHELPFFPYEIFRFEIFNCFTRLRGHFYPILIVCKGKIIKTIFCIQTILYIIELMKEGGRIHDNRFYNENDPCDC